MQLFLFILFGSVSFIISLVSNIMNNFVYLLPDLITRKITKTGNSEHLKIQKKFFSFLTVSLSVINFLLVSILIVFLIIGNINAGILKDLFTNFDNVLFYIVSFIMFILVIFPILFTSLNIYIPLLASLPIIVFHNEYSISFFLSILPLIYIIIGSIVYKVIWFDYCNDENTDNLLIPLLDLEGRIDFVREQFHIFWSFDELFISNFRDILSRQYNIFISSLFVLLWPLIAIIYLLYFSIVKKNEKSDEIGVIDSKDK